MNIQLSSVSIPSFKENALTTFIVRNKVVVIATVALALLGAAFYGLTKLAPNKWLIFKSYFRDVKGELKLNPNRNGIAAQSDRGTFRKGKLEGKGERSYSDIFIVRGYFQKGELDGQATLMTNDPHNHGQKYPKHVKTEGFFESENALINGFGKITFSDGTSYEGNFDNGALFQSMGNGINTKIHQWGTIEEGRFIDGKLIKGKIMVNNSIYEGEFDSVGRLHGQGKIILDTKVTEEGIFEYGKLKPSN